MFIRTARNAALGTLCGLVATAANARDQVVLPFWYSTGETVIETLIERFEAANPDIDVQGIDVGDYDDMVVRLQAAAVGGDVPALAQLEITRYGLFAAAGVLERIDHRLEATPEILADLRPYALEASLYLGERYVMPVNVSNPVMYYNKDLFCEAGLDPEAPPATWDALLAAAQALTKVENGETVQWGISAPPQWVRWAMSNQAGGGWMDGATNANQMGEAGTAKAYQFAADLVIEHGVSSIDSAVQERLGRQSFTAGGTGIIMGSTGSLGSYIENTDFDLGVAPLPCDVVCAAPIGGASLGILAGADDAQKDAAWKFLQFVMTPESNAEMFTVTGYLPILKSTVEHPQAAAYLAENPHYSVAINQLDVAFVRARPPAMPEIRAIEPSYWERIVVEKEPATEVLAEFAAEIDDLMTAQSN